MATCPGFQEIAESLKKQSGGSYSAHVPEGWTQGRSIYGGMIAGLALRTAQDAFGPLPPLRSMQVNFIGPVNFGAQGATIFTPTVMRRGKNVISICVDVSNPTKQAQGQLGARLLFTFGAPRTSSLSHIGTHHDKGGMGGAPELAPLLNPLADPTVYPVFVPLIMRKVMPAYFRRFDVHLIEGHRPLAHQDHGYVLTALRHKDTASQQGIESLVALADALPPAALIRLKKFTAVATISWMMNFYHEDPQTQHGWWRLDGRLHQADNGYSTETFSIWNSDGDLVAQGQQCVAIFV